jgi:hypothetical protein
MDPREKATAAALADEGGFVAYVRKHPTTRARRMDRAFTVETPNGPSEGQPGDFLCLDALGLPYACSAAVFTATFEVP